MNDLIAGFCTIGLVIGVFAVIAWKSSKKKIKRGIVNQADVANQDFMARVNGLPQSNGLMSPVFLSSQHNRDTF